MDGHDSLTLTSLSLLYRYVNVLYMRTLFLVLQRFCHAWSRLITICHKLIYIIGYDLYTVSMSLVNVT
jgi:predicted tellurium resistance membrane protein TerC